jgi:hypothetical protein
VCLFLGQLASLLTIISYVKNFRKKIISNEQFFKFFDIKKGFCRNRPRISEDAFSEIVPENFSWFKKV